MENIYYLSPIIIAGIIVISAYYIFARIKEKNRQSFIKASQSNTESLLYKEPQEFIMFYNASLFDIYEILKQLQTDKAPDYYDNFGFDLTINEVEMVDNNKIIVTQYGSVESEVYSINVSVNQIPAFTSVVQFNDSKLLIRGTSDCGLDKADIYINKLFNLINEHLGFKKEIEISNDFMRRARDLAKELSELETKTGDILKSFNTNDYSRKNQERRELLFNLESRIRDIYQEIDKCSNIDYRFTLEFDKHYSPTQ